MSNSAGQQQYEVQDRVPQGTLTQDKNEMLFSQFNINYSDIPLQFRKACHPLLHQSEWTLALPWYG